MQRAMPDAKTPVQVLDEFKARFKEFDPDIVRICAKTMTQYPDTPEPIRLARHNFLQRLATAIEATR